MNKPVNASAIAFRNISNKPELAGKSRKGKNAVKVLLMESETLAISIDRSSKKYQNRPLQRQI